MSPGPRRPGGRPPLDPSDPDGSTDVHVRLPVREYDELYAAARASRVSVPELIRRRVRQAQDDPDPADD